MPSATLIAKAKSLTAALNTIPGCETYKVNITEKGQRGRPAMSDEMVHTMRKMRLDGRFTLADIAFFIGCSQLTVFKYTKGINNFRRRNTTSRVHRRTGLAA